MLSIDKRAWCGLRRACCGRTTTQNFVQRTARDPVLAHQFEMDRTVCQGKMQKANRSGVFVYKAASLARWRRLNAVRLAAESEPDVWRVRETFL